MYSSRSKILTVMVFLYGTHVYTHTQTQTQREVVNACIVHKKQKNMAWYARRHKQKKEKHLLTPDGE